MKHTLPARISPEKSHKQLPMLSFRYSLFATVFSVASLLSFGVQNSMGDDSFDFANPSGAPGFNINDAINGGSGGDFSLPSFGKSEKKVEFESRFLMEKGATHGILSVKAKIAEHWHMYSVTQPSGGPLPTVIQLSAASKKVASFTGKFEPKSDPIPRDRGFSVPAEEHDGTIIWTAPIALAEGVDPTTANIVVTIEGQVCDDACIPVSEKVTATFGGYYPLKSASPANGEFKAENSHAKMVGFVTPAIAKPGQTVQLHLQAVTDESYHIYAYGDKPAEGFGSKPTLIDLRKLSGLIAGEVKASAKPHKVVLEKAGPNGEDMTSFEHEGAVQWTIPLKIPDDAEPGSVQISGGIGYQTCNAKGCDRPTAANFHVTLQVATDSSAKNQVAPLSFSAGDYNEVAQWVEKINAHAPANNATAGTVTAREPLNLGTLGIYVISSLIGGFILNFMPCVLPVIGLKVMAFAQQAGNSRAKVFWLNIWYSFGIISVFLILASMAAFAGFAWGQQFQYVWFQVAMACVVFAMALSFLGVWEIPIPGFAGGQGAQKLQQQEGLLGAFFKGVFTTILATPCSGPMLGPVFGFSASQPPYISYVIFGSVGLGMSLPYLVIAVVPDAIKLLPKPGAWMDTFKQLMAFGLLGTVVYLFYVIGAEYYVPALALLIGVWFACWWIGKISYTAEWNVKAFNWVGALGVAALVGAGAFYFLSPSEKLLPWQPYSDAALAQARAEGKTVMIDFTADWCPNCKLNLARAIDIEPVRQKVEENEVVTLLADWTHKNDEIQNKLLELKSNSIPVLAIYPANAADSEVIILRDVLSQHDVISSLDEAGPSAGVTKDATATAMVQQ